MHPIEPRRSQTYPKQTDFVKTVLGNRIDKHNPNECNPFCFVEFSFELPLCSEMGLTLMVEGYGENPLCCQ